MIVFKDWEITAHGLLGRQFDNLSRSIDIVGTLPTGWSWTMLVQVGEHLDLINLEPTENGLAQLLTKEQLSLAGYYRLQLRGTRGNTVKHTNTVTVYIPASMSGDNQWPTIPSEFKQIETSILNAAANAKSEANRAEEAAEMAMNTVGNAAWIGFEMNKEGKLVAVLSPGSATNFALNENGNLEVILSV